MEDYFDGRSKLEKAKNSSIFFSFKDGWGNKQYVNIPVEIEDIISLIDKYIDNIDKKIIEEFND